MLPPLPRRGDWRHHFAHPSSRISLPRYGCRVGPRIDLFEACSAFTRVAACTLALPPYVVARLSEGFRHFVTSMPAPVASGWSDCRVGFAPTGKRRLFTAHARSGPLWPSALWPLGTDARKPVWPFPCVRPVVDNLLALGFVECGRVIQTGSSLSAPNRNHRSNRSIQSSLIRARKTMRIVADPNRLMVSAITRACSRIRHTDMVALVKSW